MRARPLPEVPGVQHRHVRVNGFRMHVAEAGTGEPLVLLHGWPQHWYEWRDVIGPLAEDRRVICPDLRGFGWSETPGNGYDPWTFAADLLALMDAEGIERFDLVGHDWGGMTGFLIALEHPQRLRRFIALNIFPPFMPASAKAFRSAWRFSYQWALAMPLLGPLAARAVGLERQPLAELLSSGAWDDRTRMIFTSQFRERARAKATTSLYRNAQRLIVRIMRGEYRNANLEVPTRLIFGTGDQVLDYRLLEGIERFGDDFELELVDGAGHFVADQRPELIVERARSFFA